MNAGEQLVVALVRIVYGNNDNNNFLRNTHLTVFLCGSWLRIEPLDNNNKRSAANAAAATTFVARIGNICWPCNCGTYFGTIFPIRTGP